METPDLYPPRAQRGAPYPKSVRFDFSITLLRGDREFLCKVLLANLKANFLVLKSDQLLYSPISFEAFSTSSKKPALIYGDIENCGLSRANQAGKSASVNVRIQNPDGIVQRNPDRAVAT